MRHALNTRHSSKLTCLCQCSQEKRTTEWRAHTDTFVVCNEGQDKLHSFLEHLNSVRPSIKFTMEVEEDRKLPFLDVMVTRNEDRLVTSVYRKKTHTDRYIHFTSNHNDRVKRGVIRCLRSRATRICEAEDLEAKEEHLRTTIQKNGYPRGFVVGAMRPSRIQEGIQQAEETAMEDPTSRRKTL